jgi:hypothetical protein
MFQISAASLDVWQGHLIDLHQILQADGSGKINPQRKLRWQVDHPNPVLELELQLRTGKT